MDDYRKLIACISHATADSRLSPNHIALFASIIHYSVSEHYQSWFRVSRRELMVRSKIRARATYHRIVKDLIRFGYIRYNPSFHPLLASKMKITLAFNQFNEKDEKIVPASF